MSLSASWPVYVDAVGDSGLANSSPESVLVKSWWEDDEKEDSMGEKCEW